MASEIRVWTQAVRAAADNNPGPAGSASVFAGFTFHLLRHTACSLMARAGIDAANAAERAGHTDGGALFLRRYRHLYEDEKRPQAIRLRSLCSRLWTQPDRADGRPADPLNEADSESGRTWDRTRDLPRVKRALSR